MWSFNAGPFQLSALKYYFSIPHSQFSATKFQLPRLNTICRIVYMSVSCVFDPFFCRSIYIYIYRYPLLSLYMSCCLMLNSQLSILKSQFSNLNPPSLNSQIPAYHVSRHLHFPIFQKNPYHSQHPA